MRGFGYNSMTSPAAAAAAGTGVGAGGSRIATVSWAPFRYQGLAAERWDSEFSDVEPPYRIRRRRRLYKPPVVPNDPTEAVNAVIRTFKGRGYAAGIAHARRHGPAFYRGALLYARKRAANESTLAALVAHHKAANARRASLDHLVKQLFLSARLEDVRESQRNSETPTQAVADKPEIPVPPRAPVWLSYAGFAVGILGLYLGHRERIAALTATKKRKKRKKKREGES